MRAMFAVVAILALYGASSASASPGSADAAGAALTPAATAPTKMLAPDAARADVALMRRALETIHPGLYRYASRAEIDRAFAALDRAAASPISDVELYRRISQTLALIRCTHTKADQTEAMETWRTDAPTHMPFRFRIIEGRMIVVSSDPNQPPVARGAEIMSIDGRPVRELVRTLGAYVAADARTDWTRPTFLADDGDLMGADFDHFYPYVYGFPKEIALVVRDADGATPRQMTLAPISFRAWTKLDNGGDGYRQNFSETTTWRMAGEDVGYLRIATFVNYRKPADAAELYARAFAELKAAGAARLIVDMRDNGGGSNDAALALIDALAAAPYTYQRAARYRAVRYGDLPNFISSWGDREALFNPPMNRFTPTADGQFDLRPEFAPDILMPRQPAPTAFDGPVTVLIGPANASGATMTVAKLRDMNRVTLIGARAGGNAEGPTAGQIFNVKLPNSGIVVRVPVVLNLMDVARFDRRGGVRPDISVRETVADFRAGYDRALARAAAR